MGRVLTGSFAADERLVGFWATVGPVRAAIGTGWWLAVRQLSSSNMRTRPLDGS